MNDTKERPHILVTGCGAAGMFAAIAAAEQGAHVTVLEKNDKAGKKLYISGKGRCNLTNDCETPAFFDAVLNGKKFLYSAVYGYDASRVQRFFTDRGCPLKTERGGRVFPVSDKSSDVIKTLVYEMRRLGVRVRYDCAVKQLLTEYKNAEGSTGGDESAVANDTETEYRAGRSQRVAGVKLANGEEIEADAVIVATGGLSYPATGSTGDGYDFAKAAGHTVTSCLPSLVPFETKEDWCRELQGLTLKNVRLYALPESKPFRFDEQGELLFTHFGISGPLVLTASATIPETFSSIRFAIDLKPGLTAEQLDKRLVRDFMENAKKQFVNSLNGLFPATLVPVMARLAEEGMLPAGGQTTQKTGDRINIPREQKAGAVTAAQRHAFGALMKCLPVTVTKTRGFKEAIVTRGGINVKEINPSTMESKLCRGLFFAGEVLDCDALTGGYNLQIAWSTGYAAGVHATKREG